MTTETAQAVNWNSGIAHTRQSVAIEATMRRCHNCGADHRTWQCGEIRAALFAPETAPTWKDIALGRELCRMRWRDFSGFVALLASLTTEQHLIVYAESYVAFIRSYNVASDLTADQVIETWRRLIGVAPARQAA